MKQPLLIKLQRGNIMAMVMMAIIIIMFLVSTLINHYLVTESRAVDQSLAKIRIYWAMIGHWNYVASRGLNILQPPSDDPASCDGVQNCYEFFNYFRAATDNQINDSNKFYCQQNNCGSDMDPAKTNAPDLVNVLENELSQGTGAASYTRKWIYEDASPNYWFVITNQFFTPLNQNMALGLFLTSKGAIPVLDNLVNVYPLYTESSALNNSGIINIKLNRLYRPVFN